MMASRLTGMAAFVAILTCLTGCVVTDYGPAHGKGRSGFGYKETEIGPNKIILQTVGIKSYTAKEFWNRRADELCPGIESNRNIYAANAQISPGFMFGEVDLGGQISGTLECEGLTERLAELTAIEAENELPEEIESNNP